MPYGSKQKLGRRIVHRALSPDAMQSYEPLFEKISAQLLQNLLKKPGEFEDIIRL